MAPLLNNEIGLRRESDREVSPPAVLPAGLETPVSAALPRTAAGVQRLSRSRKSPSRSRRRLDWVELGTLGMALSCMALSIYRLFWAIHL